MSRLIRFFFAFMIVNLLIMQSVSGNEASSKLYASIQNELSRYYDQFFDVSVKDNGVVIIKGTVPSYWDKLNIFSIISKVRGVHEISDQLIVDTGVAADNTIKDNIEREYVENKAILEPEKIKVTVNNGHVILQGDVNYYRESLIALDISSWQDGVTSVDNRLKVLPAKKELSDKNLEEIVQDILHRFYPLEEKNISLKVSDGNVFLNGKVKGLWIYNAIGKDIKHIRGIKSIHNDIVVDTD
jgi:osmotically-inducible protein OsmY